MKVVAGVYTLAWDSGVVAHVDRLRESKDVLTAEVTLRMRLVPDGPYKHFYQAPLNMMSTKSRRELARELEEHRAKNSGVAWGDVVEGICVLVLRAYREGEPVEVLGLAPRPK
jgi:hypothetical protein